MANEKQAISQPTPAESRSIEGSGERSAGAGVKGDSLADVKIPDVKDGNTAGRLMTFKAPQPSRRLIRFLTPVNRWLNLGGIPGLRSLPFIGRVPGIRGIVDIPVIDFPHADEQRLGAAVSSDNSCFIVPNHPEFFTDWMLDKEVMSRLAPRTASWATHSVVNGMGPRAQSFWLKNNLIAQIPGAGGQAGKEYSINWALKGHNVLLHPEGGVGWHNDLIAHLFPGAVDMAMEAAKRGGDERASMVAPVVWKLKFNHNVERGLHRELDYVEASLQLPKSAWDDSPAARLYDVYSSLLSRAEVRYGVHPKATDFFKRQHQLIEKLCGLLAEQLTGLGVEVPALNATGAAGDGIVKELIRCSDRWQRQDGKTSGAVKPIRKLTRDLRQLQRFHSGIYPRDELTQEHVGESIKRIRNDYCKGSWRDAVNQFLPQPVGPRTAIIRVPEPLNVSELMQTMSSAEMVDLLQVRMQTALDDINQQLRGRGELITYPNLFSS